MSVFRILFALSLSAKLESQFGHQSCRPICLDLGKKEGDLAFTPISELKSPFFLVFLLPTNVGPGEKTDHQKRGQFSTLRQ
jgi:hypothetical protein